MNDINHFFFLLALLITYFCFFPSYQLYVDPQHIVICGLDTTVSFKLIRIYFCSMSIYWGGKLRLWMYLIWE